MTAPHKLLGKNVHKLRGAAGLTQEQLAERAEISHRYLQSIEAGQKAPSIDIVAKLRGALGCTWPDLLRGI